MKNMMKVMTVVGCACLLSFSAGCKKKELLPAKVELGETAEHPNNSTRFKVERVAVVYDDLAFGNARGVYILRDTETGKEYVGLSGVGVSVLGSHMVGKTSTVDER